MEIIKIRLPWSNVHLVLGDRPVLVDSGSRGDLVRIVAALHAHGADPKDLAAIVQTHGHADHAGCAASLRDLSDAPVIIHRDDAEMLRRGRNRPLRPTNLTGRLLLPLVDTPFPPLAPDIEVDGPLDLRPYGLDGRLLPLQGGHTAGSVALLLRDGAACVGDVLRGGHMGGMLLPGRANIHYFAENVGRNRAELRALVEAGAQTFHVGHGGPVPVSSVRARLLR